MPSQLNITVVVNLTAQVVTLAIPSSLVTLDSGNSSGAGQISQFNRTTGLWSTGQTGFSSVDELVRVISRAGGFFSGGVWYPTSTIQSISWS